MNAKKLLLTAFVIVGALTQASAAKTWTVVKTGGGPDGWDRVNELGEGDNVTMTCEDPGCDPCKFTDPPSQIRTSVKEYNINTDVLPYIDELVMNGQTSGSYSLDGELTVSWSATNTFNMTITIRENK